MGLTFQFDSFSAFLWMEGHGPYVWAVYVIALICFLGLTINYRVSFKRFCVTQAAIARRNDAQAKPTPTEQ